MEIWASENADGKLTVKTIPLVCQEILRNWNRISEYLSTNVPHQEMCGVKKHVSFVLILLFLVFFHSLSEGFEISSSNFIYFRDSVNLPISTQELINPVGVPL